MDFNANSHLIQTQIIKYKEQLITENEELSLTNILCTERCQNIISECRVFRDRVYNPFKTVITFIKQVISSDKSCKNAVARVVAEHLSLNKQRLSYNTGPYCKARERLPESMIKDLVKEVATSAKQNSSKRWQWRNRHVHVVDGTTVNLPDTDDNRNTFTRHNNCKGEVALPMVRIVVILSLTVGTVLDYALGAVKGKGTGEHSLLRGILDCLKKEDVLLGDAYYPSFFLMAELFARGLEGVFAGCGKRKYDFRKGIPLNKNDHIVEWKRPIKPYWMDKETYRTLPKKLCIREFKVNGKAYITTLLCNKKYHKKELAKLYEFRWQVEIALRDIKRTMNMEMLSCKTAEMVKKEIGVHFLGYNLIRVLVAQACIKYRVIPYQVSFKGCLQLINQFMPYYPIVDSKLRQLLFNELLKLIVSNKVGHRPGRIEPRALKSEKRNRFCTMKKPRETLRNYLLHQRNMKMLKYATS
jgi:hypothetical protein